MSDPDLCNQPLAAQLGPLMAILQQLIEVIEPLSDAEYTRDGVGELPGTIGGHVRHCLDHVSALLHGASEGVIDYDTRRRGTDVETSRLAAIALMRQQIRELAELPVEALDRPIDLNVMLNADGDAIAARSTVGREVAFVLSHTIHHNAIVGAMIRTLGGRVEARFGYAPSTPAAPGER